jgi:hypothetical protein
MWKYLVGFVAIIVFFNLVGSEIKIAQQPLQATGAFALFAIAIVFLSRSKHLEVRQGQPITIDKLKKRVYHIVEGVIDLTDKSDGFVQIVVVRNEETTETTKFCIAVKLTEKLPESFIKSGFYVNPHYAKASGFLSLVSVQRDNNKEIIVMPIRRHEKEN